MNNGQNLSDAQYDRLIKGWSDEEAEKINADYPEASELDRMAAAGNVEHSVWMDIDIHPEYPVSVMELYGASLEGLLEDRS
jgi:hypothetical protein